MRSSVMGYDCAGEWGIPAGGAMHLDVVDLKSFYYRTPLGRNVQRTLQERLTSFWPNVKGETAVGFGFAAPFLRPFLSKAHRVLSLMPAEQGVMPWPPAAPNLSALVEETHWPLQAASVDRLLVAHGLETCERPAALLEEIWRVLAPEGRVIFIVPNRTGAWARRDVTPFGYGRPYSFGQLEAQLKTHRFQPEQHGAALYAPPSTRKYMLRTAPTVEAIGQRLHSQRFAGALILEAQKRIYIKPKGLAATSRPRLRVLEGLAQPVGQPAGGRTGRKTLRDRHDP